MPALRFVTELLTFALLIATVFAWSVIASALSTAVPSLPVALAAL